MVINVCAQFEFKEEIKRIAVDGDGRSIAVQTLKVQLNTNPGGTLFQKLSI
jgi:hypothetical protein